MKLFPDDHETIAGTARRLRQGEITCVDVLQSCLDRIDQKEPAIRAWVLVDRDGALVQARELDAELQAGRDRGPLHGIPIGVKDMFPTVSFPLGFSAERLPLAVQLIGRPGSDLELLRVAGLCEQWTRSAHRV